MNRVSNQPLCEAFLDGDLDARAVCYELGWLDRRGYAEVTRLRRLLGVRPTVNGMGRVTHVMTIKEDIARVVARALGTTFEDLYPDTAVACGASCERCGDPMIEPAELCGFCVEEMLV